MATGLATAVLLIAFALRTASAVSSGVGWLRWATPLGWAEELRPFAGPRPGVLVLPAVAATLLLVAAGALAARRDIGSGLLPARDSAPPRFRLLGSPAAQAVRSESAALAAWIVGVSAFAFLMGVLSAAVTPDVLSENVRRQLEKLGTGSVVTPSGWLGFAFIFFILAVSVFCCMQVASMREEEAEQRLETLLAEPVGRSGWLAGRLLVAAGGAAAVALAAGVLAWAGAAAQGASVSLPRMLEAGANTLPPALLFLSLGTLAFALAPRASSAIAYGLVGLAFVWELFGALLDVPGWLLALSPFHDVGLVPGEPFEAGAAAAMLGLAGVAAIAAVTTFRQRDLTSA
jgi:ABC-2 type transport system permease protein